MKTAPPRSAEAAPSEASRRVRVPFFQRAALTVEGREEELFVVDIGHAGAFAERDEPLPVGHRVRLRFHVPGNALALTVECRVVWWHPPAGRASKRLPAGLGLEFVELSEGDRAKLDQYLSDYLAQDARGRRFHRPHPLDVAIGGEGGDG